MLVNIKTFDAPPICENEVLRYSGCKDADEGVLQLVKSCIAEAKDKLVYKVCFCESDVSVDGDSCEFEGFTVKSRGLAVNLKSSLRAVIFGATVGTELDRLISRYSGVYPSKSVVLHAFGAERIEALCDAFCSWYEAEKGVRLTRRFSPGYGDLSLEVQRDIFRSLECEKRIGLYLSDSLLMIPSKSVTAFSGVAEEGQAEDKISKCSLCKNQNCAYRREI